MPKRKWYSLNDKVYAEHNLRAAAERVLANKGAAGVDGQTCEAFAANLEAELAKLHEELRSKTYRPQPVKRVYIPKANGGQRPLGIPAVRDRVVQQALRQVIEPIFEPKFLSCSYGFREGRSAHMALDAISEALAEGKVWVVDADLKSYFDTIPHDRLIDRVAEEISDGSVLRLIRGFLESGVMEGGTFTLNETGTPQGGVISPLLANIYLHPFDVAMTEKGHKLVRYADDWVVLTGSRQAAERAMMGAKKLLEEELGLVVHPEKSRVVSAEEEAFSFLGYTFWARRNRREEGPQWFQGRRPSDKALAKAKERLRVLTKRNQTVSPKTLARRIRKFVEGWVAYYGRGQSKKLFTEMDGWLRRRFRMVVLRSWRSPRKVHAILLRRGWKREKLVGFSPYRWRNSKCQTVHAALTNEWLASVGFCGLLDCYLKLSPVRG